LDCAANPSVLAGVDGTSSSRGVVEQNLYGTVNLLELCKKWGAGFTLLSTSRVYSIPPLVNLPLLATPTRFMPDCAAPLPAGISERGVAETFSTAAPVSLYGSTKLCSEALALEYGDAFGFPVWINRCGVLAGAGQFGKADQGIFSFWIHSWKAGRPLRYIGFGELGLQVRDCLHPRDLAPVLARQFAAGAPRPEERLPGVPDPRIANFAGGIQASMSLRELSLWCADRFPGTASARQDLLNPTPQTGASAVKRPYDIAWMVLDSARAQELWGWKPVTPLADILEEIALHAIARPDWLELVAK
jgi:CDP-paratose 2-epimerase